MYQEQEVLVGKSGNYDIYVFFIHDELQVVLMSLLNDELYQLKLTNHSLSPDCKNIFENTNELHNHFKVHLYVDEQMIAIDDMGTIKIYELGIFKGKEKKFEVGFHTEKIVNEQEKNILFIKIIKERKKYCRINHSQKHIIQMKKEGEVQIGKMGAKEYQKLTCQVDLENNPHLKYFELEGANIRVNKKHDKINRVKLIFKEVIPSSGKYYISFKIQKSAQSWIGIGIAAKSEAISYDQSKTSICILLHESSIKDTNGKKQQTVTEWYKGSGNKTKVPCVIRMEIDMDEQVVIWKRYDERIGVATITNYLKNRQIVAYLNMLNDGDEVVMNEE